MFACVRWSSVEFGTGMSPKAARAAGPRQIVGAVTKPHAARRLSAALGLAPELPPAPCTPP